jgi:DNA (cytosine-5)-methyltransferase 1
MRQLNGRTRQGRRIYDADGVSATLMAQGGGFGGRTGLYAVGFNRKAGVIGPLENAHTLTAGDYRRLNRNQTQTAVFVDLSAGEPTLTDTACCLLAKYDGRVSNRKGERSGVLESGRIRKLTPRDAWRLQGWTDEQFNKAAAVNSDAQLYRQAGNGVTVPVIAAIGRQIVRAQEEYYVNVIELGRRRGQPEKQKTQAHGDFYRHIFGGDPAHVRPDEHLPSAARP